MSNKKKKTHRPGLKLPRLRKPKPGTAPGIEHADLSRMSAAGTSAIPGAPDAPVVPPQQVYISCTDYSRDHVQVTQVSDLDKFLAEHRPEWSLVRWINIDGITDLKVIESMAKKYSLHPLAVEDMLHVPQRPKMDAYPSEADQLPRLFTIARMMQMREGHLHTEQISIFLGRKTVITFQETHGDVWDPIRERINRPGSRLRNNDASFLLYALLDAIVDHCFPILEYYGDKLEEMESAVLNPRDAQPIQQIHSLKREMLLLRREVWPMREVILALQRESHECLSETTRTYLRDVYDHTVQIIDLIETYREITTALAETYMTAMGTRLNEVMKVLTIIGTIFIPLTFLAGVYGMNFEYLPEFKWHYAYPTFWIICLTVAGTMVAWFRRKNWI